jgi:hypothetical protein
MHPYKDAVWVDSSQEKCFGDARLRMEFCVDRYVIEEDPPMAIGGR